MPSFAAGLLLEVIRATHDAEPSLGLVVRDAVASRVIDLVDEEDVDLGLTGGEAPTDKVEVLHRSEDRLRVVFPRDHALAQIRVVGFKDLVDLPLVLTDHSTSVRAIVESAFAFARVRPIVVCETTHIMTATAMVASGLGVTVLPGPALKHAAMPNLLSRAIEGDAFVRPIVLVKKPRRTLSPACESFALACIAAMERVAAARKKTPGSRNKR